MIRATRLALYGAFLGSAMAMPLPAGAQTESKAASLHRESYAAEAKKDYATALAKVRDATAIAGPSYFSTMRMAWLSYLAGDFPASVAGYNAAIVAEPKAIEPKIGLTLPLLAARNWPELERACHSVLASDAHNVLALARLAQAYYWGGNYAAAATTYQQLSGDYPADLDYRTGLGWALLKSGRTGEARQIFEWVLAVSPDNANARAGVAGR